MTDTELDLALVRLDSGRLSEKESQRLEARVVKELEWRGYYDLLEVRYMARRGSLVRSRSEGSATLHG